MNNHTREYAHSSSGLVVLFYVLILSYEGYYILGGLGLSQKFMLIVKVGCLALATLYSAISLSLHFTSLRVGSLNLIILGFYLLSVFLSAVYSLSPTYVLIYAVMLTSLMLCIYHFSTMVYLTSDYSALRYLVYIFSLIVFVSLIGYLIFPSKFSYIDVWGNKRLQGLYGEPEKLAQIGSLNIFFAFFLMRSIAVKAVLISASFVVVQLAGNRAYVIALVMIVAAGCFMEWKARFWIKAIASTAVVVLLALAYAEFKSDIMHIKYLRTESLSNLSGRTEMWKKALPIALQKPFGSGYGLGGTALMEGTALNTPQRRLKDFNPFSAKGGVKTTLHNGYLQALCDLGFIGLVIYMAIFFLGLVFSAKALRSKHMNLFICVFFFYAIVNMAGTVLTGPTETNTVIFWLSWFLLMFSAMNKNASRLSVCNQNGI